jgi:hypothetical protein
MEALMRTLITMAVLFLTVLAASPAVHAQPLVYAPAISAGEAQAIAADNGLVLVQKLELDEGKWKIKGRDTTGRYMEIKIDRLSGAILELNRGF